MKKLKLSASAILITSLFFLTLVGCGSSSSGGIVLSDVDAVAADVEALDVVLGGNDADTNNVTTTLPLTTIGVNGSTVTWSSDNTSVIANDGTVVRPAFGSGNITIILTATIVRGDVTETKTFTVIVLETPQADDAAVAADKASLDNARILGTTNIDLDNVTGNITVPATGSAGTVITWVSDKPGVIANDGTVTRPAYGSGDSTVTMTATITKGSVIETKTFIIIVLETPQSDSEAVTSDKTSLVDTDIKGSGNTDLSNVTANLASPLPSAGASGTVITWSSDKPGVISNDGTVTRPTDGSGNATVTFTATITKGSETETKVFTIIVLELQVAVTGISLLETSSSLVVSSTTSITASVIPSNAADKALTYAGNNDAVATVNASGTVTAVGAGSAIITVSSANGVKVYFNVTVTASVVNVTGVSISKARTTIAIEGKEILEAAVIPANATNSVVAWSSASTSIATVNSATGEVTGVSAGDAVITATTADGSKTAACTVTVSATAVSVLSVSINKASTTVLVNASEQLYSSFIPVFATNQSAAWSSSDETKVIVDSNGKVTGIAAGSATITFTSADGSKTATCLVNVASVAVPVITVALDLNKTTARMVPGSYEQLTAEISPAGSTNQNAVWTTDHPEFVTVDQTGLIHAVAVGVAAITVTTNDGNQTATCTVTVSNTPNSWGKLRASSDLRYLLVSAGTGQSNPGVWVSNDYGYTWKQVYNADVWGVNMSTDGKYMVMHTHNMVKTSSDYGQTWIVPTGTVFTSKLVEGSAMSDDGSIIYLAVYADSGGEFVYKSSDNGASFAKSGTIASGKYSNLSCSKDGAIVGAGTVYDGGKFMHSINTGATWTQISNTSNIGLSNSSTRFQFMSKSGTQAIIGDESGYFRKSSSIWTAWTYFRTSSAQPNVIGAISATNNVDLTFKTLYATIDLKVMKSDDLGDNWTDVAAAKSWVGIVPNEDGSKLVATSSSATEGGIYVALDGNSATPTFVRRY